MNGALSLSRTQRQRPWRSRKVQRGVALIVAILLVALGTIIAATVAYENAMAARRGTATFAFDQSIMISEGAEALAAFGIRQFFQANPSNVYLGQGWDKPVGPMEVVPGVMLEASLEDMQGRLNLNNLVQKDGTPDPVYVAAFTKLLELVGLETKWAPMIVDWIDVDIVPQSIDGAEDSVYMGQTPPYRTPNRYITSTTELLALPGFGRDRYLALAPYIAALPVGTHQDQRVHRQGQSAGCISPCGPDRIQRDCRSARQEPYGGDHRRLLPDTRQLPGGPRQSQAHGHRRHQRYFAVERWLADEQVRPELGLLPPVELHHHWQCGIQFVQSALPRHDRCGAPDPAQLHPGLKAPTTPPAFTTVTQSTSTSPQMMTLSAHV